jgi:hypothetical protein
MTCAEERQLVSGWGLLWGLLATFGTPLAAIGVILWLCERSWQRPVGSMGSRWLLGAGILLCLPLLFYVAPVVLELMSR